MRIVLIGVALYGGVEYLDGVRLDADVHGFWGSFATALLAFAVVEVALHPLVRLVFPPLRAVTFGHASVALSVALVYLVSFVVPAFSVASFPDALLMGLAFGAARSLTR